MTLDTIQTMHQLTEAVVKDPALVLSAGDVTAQFNDDLVIFNYRHPTEWNFVERVCRGLIINHQTGEVVARPFDKFFNWMENGRKASGHIVSVTEKMDGSLGILYRHDNKLHVATRGSFTSSQAQWATDYVQSCLDINDVPINTTLLFEIIYPENRVVVDYAGREELVLIGMRSRFTGQYVSYFDMYQYATLVGLRVPRYYAFNRMEDVIALTGQLDNFEGWVVEFSDGSRWKIKTDSYRELHRAITQASFKNTLRAVRFGALDYLLDSVPDTLRGQIEAWCKSIQMQQRALATEVELAFENCPQTSRKDFANYVTQHYPHLSPYLFAMVDGKNYHNLILQRHKFESTLPNN